MTCYATTITRFRLTRHIRSASRTHAIVHEMATIACARRAGA